MNGEKRQLSGEESRASDQNASGAVKPGKSAQNAGNLASGEALAKSCVPGTVIGRVLAARFSLWWSTSKWRARHTIREMAIAQDAFASGLLSRPDEAPAEGGDLGEWEPSAVAQRLGGWIEHSRSEASLHVAVPVPVAEFVQAVLLGVASRKTAPAEGGLNDRQRQALSGFFEHGVSTREAIDRAVSAADPEVGQSGAKKPYSTPELTGPFRLFRITESQRMALCVAISEQMQRPDGPEVHIDCSQDPPVETTLGDLLAIFMRTN